MTYAHHYESGTYGVRQHCGNCDHYHSIFVKLGEPRPSVVKCPSCECLTRRPLNPHVVTEPDRPTLSPEMTAIVRGLYNEARTRLIGTGDSVILPPGMDMASALWAQPNPLDYLLREYGYDPVGGGE